MLGRRGQIAKRSTAKPQTVGEKLASRAKKFVAMRKAEKAKTQPSACAWWRRRRVEGRAGRVRDGRCGAQRGAHTQRGRFHIVHC